MTAHRKRKVPPIVWPIVCFLVALAASTSSHAKTIEIILVVVRLAMLVCISVIVVGMYWKHWNHRDAGPNKMENWIRRGRNWILDRDDEGR